MKAGGASRNLRDDHAISVLGRLAWRPERARAVDAEAARRAAKQHPDRRVRDSQLVGDQLRAGAQAVKRHHLAFPLGEAIEQVRRHPIFIADLPAAVHKL